VAQVQVRCRRIETQFDSQRFTGCFKSLEFSDEVFLDQQFVTAPFRYFQGLTDGIGTLPSG
jgi:hypothetical protein